MRQQSYTQTLSKNIVDKHESEVSGINHKCKAYYIINEVR